MLANVSKKKQAQLDPLNTRDLKQTGTTLPLTNNLGQVLKTHTLSSKLAKLLKILTHKKTVTILSPTKELSQLSKTFSLSN